MVSKKKISTFSQEEIQQINYILDNMVAEKASIRITPEDLREGVKDIKNSDKDGNKKFSRDEAIAYLRTNLSAPISDTETSKIMDGIKDGLRASCNMVAMHSHLHPKPEEIIALENSLSSIGKEGIKMLELRKEVADLVDHPNSERKEKIIKQLSNNALKGLIGRNIEELDDDFIKHTASPKIDIISREVFERMSDALKSNPDIKRDLQSLPDMSELGNLTANHVCGAFPEPNTNKNMQTTKVNR